MNAHYYWRLHARVSMAMLGASLLASAQSTERVNVGLGGQANSESDKPSISADGRFVAFQSLASNLVAGDTNNVTDIFVRDRATGTTTRVSVDSQGVQSNGTSYEPSISADGRFVAFWSFGDNLVPGDTNGLWDAFVHDCLLGQTVRVSVDSAGLQANSWSERPVISADGSSVAFWSAASNLVAGDTNLVHDVFVRHLPSGVTRRASVSTGGAEADQPCYFPSISADGGTVAFYSRSTTLVAGDSNGTEDIFVRTLSTGVTVRASLTATNGETNNPSLTPTLSANGRYCAFASSASNIVSGDTNNAWDVFVRDLSAGTTTLVTVGLGGIPAAGHSYHPAISGDGRIIAFTSEAENLVTTQGASGSDVYARDWVTGQVVLLSTPPNSALPASYSETPVPSIDGRFVAFRSDAGNLVSGDTNGVTDIFIRDWYTRFWQDADADGYGTPLLSGLFPQCPAGFSPNSLDCDDSAATTHPGAPDLCDGVDNDCDSQIDEGFIAPFCTAGTSVHGCTAWIAGVGTPSTTAGSGFNIAVNNVPGQRYGTIFYGFYPANVPWAPNSPSYRCVSFPIQRMGNLPTHGSTNQCNGDLTIDFNAWYAANPGALGAPFIAGQVFYAQGWYRDPAAPKQTNLSNGLRFTLCN